MRDGGFLQGWNGRMLDIRNQERQGPTICDRCHIRSLCSMCAANGELESGHPEAPVDFLCQVAHLRAFALGIEPPEHGDCPCCKGGVHHDDLARAAKRIVSEEKQLGAVPVAARPGTLNILREPAGCQSGGCGSCGAHR